MSIQNIHERSQTRHVISNDLYFQELFLNMGKYNESAVAKDGKQNAVSLNSYSRKQR